MTRIPRLNLKNNIHLPVFLSSCSPKEITGIAEAKNMYVVGARILYKRVKSMIKHYRQTSRL
jgi:hypothetical protein